MEIKIHFHEENKLKRCNICKQGSLLVKILNSVSKGEIVSNISIIIGSDEKLKSIANSYHIPFFYIDHVNHIGENRILQLVDQFDIDLIVGRYMRILTPNFAWRYLTNNKYSPFFAACFSCICICSAYERGKNNQMSFAFCHQDLDQAYYNSGIL